ncbi:YegP family protein [Paludisphaera rhizosphaerae]|uniref:YegP family protein n=1 Tax=Paludisphaera rhizosphaerae TaxID=2711216 RepID=UPI0013EB7067|nr:DUF1508 domain-containing protein [Paludisphaera rhizosphaerae]
MNFYIYRDDVGEYRWRMQAASSEIVAVSGPGYHSNGECRSAIERIRSRAAAAGIIDETATPQRWTGGE